MNRRSPCRNLLWRIRARCPYTSRARPRIVRVPRGSQAVARPVEPACLYLKVPEQAQVREADVLLAGVRAADVGVTLPFRAQGKPVAHVVLCSDAVGPGAVS